MWLYAYGKNCTFFLKCFAALFELNKYSKKFWKQFLGVAHLKIPHF